MTLNKFSLAASLLALAVSAHAASANLIVNGDFQTGTLGPSVTTYDLGSPNMVPETTWNIVSFDTLHDSWADFHDHTLGNDDGRFMVVNGKTTFDPAAYAWAQTVSVVPNTDYDISAWFASLFPESVATISFRVRPLDGDSLDPLVSASFLAPTATELTPLGTWQQHAFTFNSGDASSIKVEIFDTSGVFSGNDYAIDDISLAPTVVPEPAALGALAPAGLLLARRRRA